MAITDYLNPHQSPAAPPPRTRMHQETQRIHDGIDAAMRASGLPYLHPDGGPTVQLDLLGAARMAAWQEGKVQFLFEGEGCWSELPQVYARYGTETTRRLLAEVRQLEGASCAVLTDSGAQAAALLMDAVLEPGRHIVLSRQIYNKTRKYAEWAQNRLGGTVTLVDQATPDCIDAAITPLTVLVVVETYSNPLMRAIDPDALAALILRRRRADAPDLRLAVDNTIATPWGVRTPLLGRQGVDFVIAAGTKALGGQDRDLWGYVASNLPDVMNQVMDVQAFRGGILDWRRAEAVLAGLDQARAAHCHRCETATRVAHFLDGHPRVEAVYHPSVAAHPDRAVIDRAYALPGALLSFRIAGADEVATRHFTDVLAMTGIIRYALSFDGPASKVNHHQTVSEYFTPVAELQRQGMDRLVRFAVGGEAADDLIACLNWALWHATEVSAAQVAQWQAARAQSLGVYPAAPHPA